MFSKIRQSITAREAFELVRADLEIRWKRKSAWNPLRR